MKSVTYGELRSQGYPNFSNTRHELTIQASLEPGESAKECKDKLFARCKEQVKLAFGDKTDQRDLFEIPFE